MKAKFLNKYRELRIRRSVSRTNYRFIPKIGASNSIAVIVHLYYPELWESIRVKLLSIDQPFDLFVSVRNSDVVELEKISLFHKETNIVPVPNRGRDVLPFLMIMEQISKLDKYNYILKIHTKKSKHRKDGSSWFNEILDELLPKNIKQILDTLKIPDTGLIGPSDQIVSLSRYMGDNSDAMTNLLTRMFGHKKASDIMTKQEYNPFFGGTMFWARADFFNELLELDLKPGDFPEEQGQVDGTIAHAIERIIGKAAHRLSKKKMYSVNSNGDVREIEERLYIDVYKHV